MVLPLVPLKVVAALGLALILSLGANVWQLYRAGVAAGEAAGEREREVLAGDNALLRQREAVAAALAQQARLDGQGLLADLQSIAERGREVRVVYRAAAAAAPLAVGCAPGAGRMDAVNRGLGPQEGGP